MYVVIGTRNNKMDAFIEKFLLGKKYMIVDKMCTLNRITKSIVVIIPFGRLEPNGLITNTYVHIPELLMTCDVKMIICHQNMNFKELTGITSYFKVPVKKLEDSI